MPFIHPTKSKSEKSETSPLTQKNRVFSSSNNRHEEIKKRAEEIYHSRNGGPGNDLSDWLQAEKEVNKKYNVFFPMS